MLEFVAVALWVVAIMSLPCVAEHGIAETGVVVTSVAVTLPPATESIPVFNRNRSPYINRGSSVL